MAGRRTESVEKASSLLLAFNRQKPRMTLAELARETELNKSTILRLANSLILYGFLSKDSDGRYSLGASVWQLGVIFRNDFNRGEVIRPFLRLLVEQTGETATFFVRAGADRVCLHRENCANLMHYGVDEGMRLRLDDGASGLVLRRFTGEDVSAEMEAFNANGTANLEQTRNPNIASISTPIFSASGDLRGALTVSGVNTRFTAERRAEAIPLLENAREDLERIIA